MTICPKCHERPSRKPQPYRGKVPLCAECYARARQHNNTYWATLRSRARSELRDTPGYGAHDISAAEIERRYRTALAQIRARRAQEAE